VSRCIAPCVLSHERMRSGAAIVPRIISCWGREGDDPTIDPHRALKRSHSLDGAFRTVPNPGAHGEFVAVEFQSDVIVAGVSFEQFACEGNGICGIALECSTDGATWHEALRAAVPPHGSCTVMPSITHAIGTGKLHVLPAGGLGRQFVGPSESAR
jgi:hypothetical protein